MVCRTVSTSIIDTGQAPGPGSPVAVCYHGIFGRLARTQPSRG